MRLLLLILMSVICKIVSSQSNLDSLIFDRVNNYRVSMSLEKVQFDSICFMESNSQSTYMFKNSLVSHSQDFTGYETSNKRYLMFGGSSNFKICAEICTMVKINVNLNDSLYSNKLSEIIFESWKKSKEHNKILLNPNFKFAGVSSQCIVNRINDKLNYQVFCTMFFIDIR